MESHDCEAQAVRKGYILVTSCGHSCLEAAARSEVPQDVVIQASFRSEERDLV
jgi:hypothetical protein